METYIRSGAHARKPPLPYTPGTDVAGVIEAVGEHVTVFKVLYSVSFLIDGLFFPYIIVALLTATSIICGLSEFPLGFGDL